MARKQKAEQADKAEAVEKPSGKRSMLIPAIVVAIAVLGAGAMAGGMIGGGGGDAAADPLPSETETEVMPELGALVQLDSVTLNLAQGRFLKLGVAVELSPDVDEAPPTAPIYDEVIKLFGPLTFEQLSDTAVRERTKQDLLAALADVYGEQIVGIYYTEFVMQ